MLKNLDHVGIVVNNLDNSLKRYCDILNLNPAKLHTFSDGRVKLSLMPMGGGLIELLEPITSGSRFSQHLKEKGEGLFHLAFYSNDYDSDIKALKAKGYKLEEETATQSPGNSVRMAWLPPEATGGIWIEIFDKIITP